jgi:hypothetical protein
MGKHAPGRSSAIPQRQIQYWQRLPSSTVIPHYLPTAAVAAVLPNANALGPKPSGPTRGAGTRGTGKPLYAPIPKPQRAVRAVRVGASWRVHRRRLAWLKNRRGHFFPGSDAPGPGGQGLLTMRHTPQRIHACSSCPSGLTTSTAGGATGRAAPGGLGRQCRPTAGHVGKWEMMSSGEPPCSGSAPPRSQATLTKSHSTLHASRHDRPSSGRQRHRGPP